MPAAPAGGESIADPRWLGAAADLYHTYFTGLILTVASRRNGGDAAEWVFRVFRHQHHEKFLSSFEKLGLSGMPHAVACAAYHYLSNAVGGVTVEFMRESDRKAWVRFVPPRWIYPAAAICGVPSEVSRAMLRGWYAQNGVSLGNPRIGFVCTAQTVDGQHGHAGYFLEHARDLSPEECLQFRPGELPPPFDPALAPVLPEGQWPEERLAKANRNYAMEYVRSGLPRLVELFGPADASHLGRVTGQLVGAQCYRQTADALGVKGDTAQEFGDCAPALKQLRRVAADQPDAVVERDVGVDERSISARSGLEPSGNKLLECGRSLHPILLCARCARPIGSLAHPSTRCAPRGHADVPFTCHDEQLSKNSSVTPSRSHTRIVDSALSSAVGPRWPYGNTHLNVVRTGRLHQQSGPHPYRLNPRHPRSGQRQRTVEPSRLPNAGPASPCCAAQLRRVAWCPSGHASSSVPRAGIDIASSGWDNDS
jgi:hypothetical protein